MHPMAYSFMCWVIFVFICFWFWWFQSSVSGHVQLQTSSVRLCYQPSIQPGVFRFPQATKSGFNLLKFLNWGKPIQESNLQARKHLCFNINRIIIIISSSSRELLRATLRKWVMKTKLVEFSSFQFSHCVRNDEHGVRTPPAFLQDN